MRSLLLVASSLLNRGRTQDTDDVLLTLFHSTNGRNWKNNTGERPQNPSLLWPKLTRAVPAPGWGENGNHCQWYGVRCSGSDIVEEL